MRANIFGPRVPNSNLDSDRSKVIPMWNVIIEHAKENAGKMVFGSIASILVAIAGFGAAIYQSTANRVAEMRLAEVKEITAEKMKFNELLQSFTGEVSIENKMDPSKKSEISASLTRLYGRYSSFRINVSEQDASRIDHLMSSINDVKKNIQLLKEKSDMDRLSVSLVYYYRQMKVVDPIVGTTIGINARAKESNL